MTSLPPEPAGPVRTALYRVRDADHALLYVGITGNPDMRFGQHSADKDWWPQVVHREVEWFDTREEALAAESTAIRSENPRHNKARYPSATQTGGKKTSIWLPEEVAAQWKATGLPLSELVRIGLATAPFEPLEDLLARLASVEIEAAGHKIPVPSAADFQRAVRERVLGDRDLLREVFHAGLECSQRNRITAA